MKRTLIALLAILPLFSTAQTKNKIKKYPSLLWEITGNGLSKPSYLFGTMHVSSKIAFHLADSFYLGIRNADVVALETNPESWQEDMSKYETGNEYEGYRFSSYLSMPNDFLSINTLKFLKYDKKIERSLYSSPSTINNLLYRSYGNSASDFEEDTYLDMYIYQCGKKWGKKVAGVERYGESMKLMQEAYRDAMKDKNKREHSYDVGEDYSPDKLQESYRKGNLDQLDSINRLNSFSDAFDEKFLYKRNDIQASSIDSILKKKLTLFVGVGAAHLPGKRGVIEMLRDKGYRLRPVMMGERDSRHKEQVEKLRVPVVFNTSIEEDKFFKVDIPGKFYEGEEYVLKQKQYADMANGSYYMVTRILTNAWMWGHSTDDVYKKVDSLLYENIPGKMIAKTKIVRNGYTGFDITNKTRRGDIQRYNIFITPFEIVVFKMGGTGDYVSLGDEAKKFFGSIQFQENKATTEWKKFSPVTGGFSVDLPHQPFSTLDDNWIYDAEDKTTGTQYRVIRTDIHNYSFVEEDTFDLGLLDESFAASEFIDKSISRTQTKYKGYPALDCKYKDKNAGIYLVRYLIQGPHYYTLVAHGKQETSKMQSFLNSFELKPFIYGEVKEKKDTSLYYTVKTPVYPEERKEKIEMPRYNYGMYDDEDGEETEMDQLESGAFRNKLISNDTTGEKIFVTFIRSPRYYYSKDSAEIEEDNYPSLSDSTWIIRSKKKYELPNKFRVWEKVVSDTGSSRMIWTKHYYKDGVGFSLVTMSDTLTPPSAFLKSFYDTFNPADTLKGPNPFEKKSALFFSDFLGTDTVAHKRAVKSINDIIIDSSDFPLVKKAIASLGWKEKNYLLTKTSMISKLKNVKTRAASDYLKEVYFAAGDTIQLQHTALQTMLQQQTSYSYSVFRDIITADPPVLEAGSGGLTVYPPLSALEYDRSYYGTGRNSPANEGFLQSLNDTLKLTSAILPDLLPLLNLDDYKMPMMRLLANMVDSNLVKPKDYEIYFSKFLIEAKQAMKKQAIAEKNLAIEKAEEAKRPKNSYLGYGDKETTDYGNSELDLYATLLLPYWDRNPNVQPLLTQMLNSNDKRLKYNIMLMMLRNNKSFNDTVLNYFAGMDEYRYELYSDLQKLEKPSKFPEKYNNHLDLGRSSLISRKSYDKPDTLGYVDRLPAQYKDKKGWFYFFKYKSKKDDGSWKLAIVGLVPDDPKKFEFENKDVDDKKDYTWAYSESVSYNKYDFTDFTETKIDEEEPLLDQLNKEKKKKLYSKRKSARIFYNDRSDYGMYDYGLKMNYND